MAVGLVALLVLSLALTAVGTVPASATSATAPAVTTLGSTADGTSPARSAIPGSVVSLLESRIQGDEHSGLIPGADVLAPNLAYTTVREGSTVVPSNIAQGGVQPGPTSIGVNDLGLRVNSVGTYVPYSYRTTSLDGTVAINNISLLPIENNASNSLTLQLNSILNNVTVFGHSDLQIWAQNVIFYSLDGDHMQLATDAWNFTGAPFQLFGDDIYAHSPGGFLFTGTYVHAVPTHPPAFTLMPPFKISFYLNSTNIAGRNALFFNYSLWSGHDITFGNINYGHTINDGSFDWIIFNSTAGMPAGYTAPPASFLISGSQASNLGLPNDAEMAICGGSDGFSSVIRSLNATSQLQFLNGTTGRYDAVPAAFTTTEDTGESVEGVDAHFTPGSAATGTVYLTNGPEYVYGLWNATAPGIHEKQFAVDASPASTLVWVSPKSKGGSPFDDSMAAWDLAPGARSSFWLPTGAGQTFVLEGMANDYTPVVAPLSSAHPNHVSLTLNLSEGLYVPIIAFGNAQVATIAQSGDGSAAHPYVISYPQYQPISSLFAVYDFFGEPLYPGLLLSGVTAHVVIPDPPNFRVTLSPEAETVLGEFYGLYLPSVNNLPIEIYDSSNIALVGAHDITGWFPVLMTGFLMASLFLSNDSHLLIADDTFLSMGSSMVIVNPGGNRTMEDNTVFGNVFSTSPIESSPYSSSLYFVVAFNTTYTGSWGAGGLGVFSSGNTIYNNRFDTPIPAYSPPQDPYLAYTYINDFGYTDFPAVEMVWHNHWNISAQPTTYVRYVDGFPLTGGLPGVRFQGGNAWSGWTGAIPYGAQGLIVGGGDALPLPTAGSPVFAIVFEKMGLPSGTVFSVNVGGDTYFAAGAVIVVYEAPGTYTFTVGPVSGHAAHPAHGTVSLSTSDVKKFVVFS